jgi:crotonobetainyl-CoA:carnitine CoA-transferase CaiB-like acyl-CoA transferase
VLAKPSLLQNKSYKDNEKRIENQNSLYKTLQDALSTMRSDDLEQKLIEHNIAYSYMNRVSELWYHTLVESYKQTVNLGDEEISILRPPIDFGQVDRSSALVPGQHTEEILL